MVAGLLAAFASRRRSSERLRVAQELAVLLAPTLRASIARGSLPVDRAEARGYVKALSTPIVRKQVSRYFELSASDNTAARATLHQEISERLVRLVLDEALRSRRTKVQTRKAA
jgi:hypothetical protein